MSELFHNTIEEEKEAIVFLEKMMEKIKDLFQIGKLFTELKTELNQTAN
jgi:hypothetical protein